MVAVSLKKKIRKEISGSKSPFYYLAIPPSLFDNAVKHLENSGCAKDGRIAADFFKQKTAYGILGCDWSSDVCSSDLGVTGMVRVAVLVSPLASVIVYCTVAEQIGRASCRERVSMFV